MADEFNDERVGELGRRRLRPLPVDLYIFPEDWNHDRILRHGLTEILQNEKKIIEQNKEIMADLSKLKTSVDNLSAKVDSLIADTTSQAAVDALQAEVDGAAAKIDAVLPPAAPAA